MGLTVGHICVLMNLAVGNSGFGHITFALSHMHWYPGFSRMSRHWGVLRECLLVMNWVRYNVKRSQLVMGDGGVEVYLIRFASSTLPYFINPLDRR